jgi:hypothetical protein
MKRIAAIAALIITMLAIPTAAMASSTSSGTGPGYTKSGPVTVVCLLPARLRKEQVKVTVGARVKAIGYLRRHRHGKPVLIRIGCPDRPVKPRPGSCPPQVLKFDMASGSSTLTEVSGPMLTPPEQFSYDGSTYTIMSINPGADSFKVFGNGWLFVNKGPAITDGIALMTCCG